MKPKYIKNFAEKLGYLIKNYDQPRQVKYWAFIDKDGCGIRYDCETRTWYTENELGGYSESPDLENMLLMESGN